MRRLFLLLPLLLAGCGIVAPPRDNAQWQSSVQGVQITWRYVAPAALGTVGSAPIIGHASTVLLGQSCVIDLDPALVRQALPLVAAHEVGHCLQMRYVLPSLPRPDLGEYFAAGREGYAQTYALAYLAACGDSLKPLGWADYSVPTCAEAPDPTRVYAGMP